MRPARRCSAKKTSRSPPPGASWPPRSFPRNTSMATPRSATTRSPAVANIPSNNSSTASSAPSPTGVSKTVGLPTPPPRRCSTKTCRGFASISTVPSTRRFGSTSASINNTASAKAAAKVTGAGTSQKSTPFARPANIISRKPAPALSRASATPWKTSCGSPSPKRCSLSTGPAPAPTFPPSAPPVKSSLAAVAHPVPFPSCASTIRSPML